MTRVRTRFAPSPTGHLHLGNLRIAVFNHLFARHHHGDFVLRVEDTDAGRTRAGSLEGILRDLRWAGLEWDEGPDRPGPFGPYRQSERTALHRTAAMRLLAEGKAYRCFCSEERIASARTDPAYTGPSCPGRCRELAPTKAEARSGAGEPAVLRFALPDTEIRIGDAIRGAVAFHGSDVGDFVLLRADGRPTYHLAVVVDDVAMEISHVIRGAGHLSNTPKHHVLFEALGAPVPVFAHLPTVLGEDRRKLSKREGATSMAELQSRGYHPDGVVNYVSLLGWSPGGDREILSRDALIEALTLERVGASDTVFDPEKLLWCSEQHIARMSLDDLLVALEPFLPRDRFPLEASRLPMAVEAIRTRLRTYSDAEAALALLYPGAEALRDGWRELRAEDAAWEGVVGAVREVLSDLDPFDPGPINAEVREAGKAMGVRGPALFHPVRLALMGARSGPDMGLVMAALGREEVLQRLAAPDDAPV